MEVVLIVRGFRLELGYILEFYRRIIPEASVEDNREFVRYGKGG